MPAHPSALPASRTHTLRLAFLWLWAVAAFGGVFFAPALQGSLLGWPLHFWWAAQGCVLFFIALMLAYAWLRNAGGTPPAPTPWRLHALLGGYTVAVLLFVLLMAWLEQKGLSRNWIGPVFLFVSVLLYTGIGIAARSTQPDDFYVAGRRVPAVYNGMATAADWMSAATFISLSGALYLQGFSGTPGQPGGLAYVLGWTGGFCLVGLLIAPRLRAMQLYTVPDFFAVRFGGRWPRMLAALGAIACSFIYVVAQIYAIGVIASRLTGVQFEIGILLGLGGVLVCSFLGGMRAITWTQIAQYVLIVLAFMIPVSWLAYKQLGTPLAPLVYGEQLPKIAALELNFHHDAAERAVRAGYQAQADQYSRWLQEPAASLQAEHQRLQAQLRALRAEDAPLSQRLLLQRELAALPADADSARAQWQQARNEALARAQPLGGLPPHSQAFAAGSHPDSADLLRRNFLALMFCLMVGTASLPHLLTRFYTTASVADTRRSVAWSLLFIAVLYLSAPALAVLVKYEIMARLVGTPFTELPAWMGQWARVDPALIAVQDSNGDGRLQFAELHLGIDMIVLASAELGGLPYAIAGLVAAGGLAAALSSADSLLLTISNALVHDMRPLPPHAPERLRDDRLIYTKFTLLAAAMLACAVAALKPAHIILLVTASFSLAAAVFFPAMILGLYWPRTTARGATAGMLAGLGLTLFYMLQAATPWRHWLALTPDGLWWGISPNAAAVFGVPAGFAVALLVSWLDKKAAAPPCPPLAFTK